jgi:hypothetical protein
MFYHVVVTNKKFFSYKFALRKKTLNWNAIGTQPPNISNSAMCKPRKSRREHELCLVLMLGMTKGQEHFSTCKGKCQETAQQKIMMCP